MRRSGHHARRRKEGGAALVEFALVLPLLLMLILGGITAGLALDDRQQMNHAVREAARFASTAAPDQFSPASWDESIRAIAVERSAGALDTGDICVSLVQGSADDATLVVYGSANKDKYTTEADGSSPCIPDEDYPVTGEDNGLRVQVTGTKPATIQLGIFGAHSITLSVDGTARLESDG